MKMKKYEYEKFDFVLGDDYSFMIALHERIIARQLIEYEEEKKKQEKKMVMRKVYKKREMEKRKLAKLKAKMNEKEENKIFNPRLLSQETQEKIKEIMIKELTQKVTEEVKRIESGYVLKIHEELLQERIKRDAEFSDDIVRHKVYHKSTAHKYCCECGIEIDGDVRHQRCLKCYRKMRSGKIIYSNPIKRIVTNTDGIGTDTDTNPDKNISQEDIRKINLDILDGLNENQKAIIKWYVNKGFNPMGFSVYINDDEIYYMGKNIKEII